MADPVEIIGREQELNALDSMLGASTAALTVGVIDGEPGAGKTTLWRATVERARSRSFRVLSVRAAEAESTLWYAGLVDLLRDVGEETLADLPSPQRRALEVTFLRSDADHSADRRTVATATLSIIQRLARDTPVVVAIDDLQWLDRSTTRAVAFACRRLDTEPVLILAATRTMRSSSTVNDFLQAAPADRLRVVPLNPLSLGALGQLIHGRVGLELPRYALVEIDRITRGNPLFALEIAEALRESGETLRPGTPLPVSEDLRDLLVQRVARLPGTTRRTLLFAAAMAHPTEATLRAAAGDDAGQLEPAVRANVVELSGERVRFTHPLVAAAVYESATHAERRAVHGRLAEIVDDPEERAQQRALAASGPDAGVADELADAATAAIARGARDQAASLLEQAAQFTPPDGDTAAERLFQAAEQLFAAGELEPARVLLDSIIEGGTDARLRADALRLLGEVLGHAIRLTDARVALERAAVLAVDDRQRSEVELDLSYADLLTGTVVAAHERALSAAALAEGSGDDVLLGETLGVVMLTSFLNGNGVDAVCLERALGLEVTDRTRSLLRRPAMAHGLVLMWTDCFGEAIEVFEKLRLSALDHGQASWLPLALFALTRSALVLGDVDRATAYAAMGHDAAIFGGDELSRAIGLASRATVAAHIGDLDDATEAAQASLDIVMAAGMVAGAPFPVQTLGRVALVRDDHAGAHATLAPFAAFTTAVVREPSQAPFLVDDVEALVALGELDQANGLIDWIEERGNALERPREKAMAARGRALVAAARGDVRDAMGWFDAAVVHHDELADRFELGRTLLSHGRVARRNKKWGLARSQLAAAVAEFRAVRATPWEQKAQHELERIGGRRAGAVDLTATEQQVAELVAAGMTTTQIASATFMSPHTVDDVLGRIYRKVGVTTRAALVAHMTGHTASTGGRGEAR